jgi:cytochrome c peroxidase
MRFEPEAGCPANAGLGTARDLLARVRAEHAWVSTADLWQFAAVVAVAHMGGPAITFTPGRTDAPSGAGGPPADRLPDADKGSDAATAAHVRAVFGRMGFNDQVVPAQARGAHLL